MADLNGFMLLVDPDWQPGDGEPDPPVEVLLGAWLVDEHGQPGLFQPNPAYKPLSPQSPLDPVDAVLRTIAANGTDAEMLPSVLTTVTLGIAVDDEGVALVRPAPDGQPCVLVATSHGHRRATGVDVPSWYDISLSQLAAALPETGVDVLLNPASATPMLLLADMVRATAANLP